MSFHKVKFAELFSYENKSSIKAGDGLSVGKYPFFTSSSIQSKYLNKYSFSSESLIFGTGGNASIHYSDEPFSVSTDCLVAVTKDNQKCLPKYVFYYLFGNIHILEEGFKGAGLKHISKSFIQEIEIPLPPLPIQKHIAEILDAAYALKHKDQQLLNKYNELAQAIFIDMFGDPVKNEKGWQRVLFKEILEKIESGWSPVCSDKSASKDEWGVLKLGAITKCVYNENENKALLKCEKPRESIEVKNGDLLFSRKNTYELVAACALVQKTRPHLMLSDLIFRFKLKQESIVSPIYLHGLLTHISKRSNIQSLAGGAAGSMPNISKEKLMGIEIELPPYELQKKYALIIETINNSHENAKESYLKTNQLFETLIQKAFTGEHVN